MNLLDALKGDHDEAKSLLEELLAIDDAKQRTEKFKTFKAAMTAHSRSEEKVFYRAMQKTEQGKDDALEGEVEHEMVDRLMDDLSRSRSKDSDAWTARCRVLKELVEHHVEEEEGEFFGVSRKMFDDAELEKMGEQFEGEKQRHHAPRHAAE